MVLLSAMGILLICLIFAAIFLVLFVFFWIYNKVREFTRVKLEYESEKVEYINQRFSNVKWELEEGEHSCDSSIYIEKPYRKTKNWKVFLMAEVYDEEESKKSNRIGENKEKTLLDISDSELQKLINPNKEQVKKDQNKIIDKKPETNFIADELLKLNQLKESGILTEEEFEQQKKKLF